MAIKPLTRWLALLAGAAAGIATVPFALPQSEAQATPPGAKDVTATLFQWRFDAVARECTETLGPKGYGFVEVSPATEHVQGPEWWTSYQPVSYRIAGRLGDRAAFKKMIDTCHAAGVKVIADAVINHMAGRVGGGVGTGGSSYGKYDYPGYYQTQDFHSCRRPIDNYQDRYNVQNCELVELADLDTGSTYVRGRIAEYLDDLASLGVDGFRIDAAKHIAADDLAAIKAATTTAKNRFWVFEVIHGAGEAVQPEEYQGLGDVDEFRYGRDLKRIFTGERLAYLENFGASWGYLPSAKARTFIDNWDTERNGSTLTYRDGSTYTLANVFMLAHPYGSPNVYSGYEFSQHDAGPPNGGAAACFSNGWKCQHRWRQIANMVAFRNTAAGTGITNWWSNGNNAIAFGRGDRAFVAINRESTPLTRTFTTSLPAGTYCDVQHGDPTGDGGCTGPVYTVGPDGTFTATVGAGDAIALHIGARTGGGGENGETKAAFAVHATTSWGQNIHVTGDHAALGGWDPVRALPLSSADYPVWKLEVSLPPGTSFEYKYLRKEGSQVTWESGANRTATVPASGTVTLNDTWRG